MQYEYLAFNLFVISGPLFFGSLKKFYFLNYNKLAIISISVSAIPFIIWDIAVTNKHWFFSDEYTLKLRIFGLPIEELLFFFTVPYACLFTWQMLKKYRVPTINKSKKRKTSFNRNNIKYINILVILIFIIISVISFLDNKEYTSLASLAFAFSILIDILFGANIFNSKIFWKYFLFITIFTLLFNGFLTWRPIVTYNPIYQIDFKIFTIPIEDFFFGYALLLLCTTIFEKLIAKTKL